MFFQSTDSNKECGGTDNPSTDSVTFSFAKISPIIHYIRTRRNLQLLLSLLTISPYYTKLELTNRDESIPLAWCHTYGNEHKTRSETASSWIFCLCEHPQNYMVWTPSILHCVNTLNITLCEHSQYYIIWHGQSHRCVHNYNIWRERTAKVESSQHLSADQIQIPIQSRD